MTETPRELRMVEEEEFDSLGLVELEAVVDSPSAGAATGAGVTRGGAPFGGSPFFLTLFFFFRKPILNF